MLRCSNCGTTNGSSREVAEFGLGWRFWSGQTVGGKEQEVSLCPTCSGCTPEPEAGDPGWSARCRTCDWDWLDDFDDTRLSEAEARELARDHRCEPWTEAYEIQPRKPASVVTVQTLAGVL